MSDAFIKIEDLTIFFGNQGKKNKVVSHLNFVIKKGQCVGIVGESGSGKTLTALSIMQLLPVMASVSNRSRIIWNNQNLLDLSEKKMKSIRGLRIGMIFQDAMSAFNPVLTIGQQMKEILIKKKIKNIKAHALLLLKEVGIDDVLRTYTAYPHQLSGGMRQRAMIAMALCGEPDLIIADEPTTALDVTLQAQILKLLKDLKTNRHLTLLFISHDLSAVAQLEDEIIVLKQGEMIEANSRQEFFLHPKNDYTKRLLSAMPTLLPRQALKPQSVILKVEDLKVYFPIRKGIFKRKVGDIKAVDGVNFTLGKAQTCALVGESGSGKTTTALAIVKLLRANAGNIFFENVDIEKLSSQQFKDFRKEIQLLFQDPYAALNPRMMIADSIIEGLRTQNIVRRRRDQLQKVDELLAQVGLASAHKWRYPHEFSGGERQRICIARALAVQPKLLILDEPTSALDVSNQLQILALLEKLQKQQALSYLLITHNLGVVAYLSHTMAVMQHGKIVEHGPTEVLLQQPQHPYTQKLLAALPRVEIKD